ncbi:MAG: hypothetical protein M0Z61_07165 [Nitrospiraceae bacterium]|nr:hypothetical protein [Nitrospiraceae bacterium]
MGKKDKKDKKSKKERILFFAVLFFAANVLFSLSFANRAQATIYININNPERRVPIAISPLAGLGGSEISKTVQDDLDYTGLFVFLDPKGFTERAFDPFKREDWIPAGVLFVLKGTVNFTPEGEFQVSATLYDVDSGRALLSKTYNAPEDLIRPLAHSMAEDIYQALTGMKGPFTSRLAFITLKRGKKDIVVSDWDSRRMRFLGLNESMLLPPRWSRDGRSLLYSAQRGRAWGIYRLVLSQAKEYAVFRAGGTNLAGDIDSAGDVVFSSSFKGSPNLYEKQSDGSLERLTRSLGIEVSPAFSPHGKRIAFVSDRSGSAQIYIMGSDGYNSSRITFQGDYNTSPAWSPDGKRIVFAGRYNGANQIFTVNTDGSDLRLLTDEGVNDYPCFSPDGGLIAFTSNRDGHKAIYVMQANGQNQKRLSPPGMTAYGARWSYQ